MKFGVTVPPVNQSIERERVRFRRDNQQAGRIATDRASKDAQKHIQRRMRSVGLGRLGGAVGQTSALKKRQHETTPYGVIYAKGKSQPDSRGAAAIEAYTEGVTIRARRSQWLAYQTDAIPKRAGRFRMTPQRYQTMGFETSLGPLEFRPINPRLALLVIKKVTLSPKTGRAKRDTGRRTRTRIRKKEVVAFVLIKETRRAQRLDHRTIVAIYHRKVPDYMAEAVQKIRTSRGA